MEEPQADASATDPSPVEPIVCPQCGEPVDATSTSGPVAQCPACGTQFFPPQTQIAEELSDDATEQEQTQSSKEEELSALKIRQFSTLRRTAYRTRSYFIIGTVGCVWVMIPLLINACREIREHHRWGLWPTVYVLFGMAALAGAHKFGRRAMEVQREINAERKARELEELDAARHEPDLSQLSDGSHHARNLEGMFDSAPEDFSATDKE